MTDSDDAVTRRYRESAREEPPAALDAAILAASRRAVGSRPPRTRWAVPASIAAVLILGIGVSLRMQLEQPGIETSPTVSSSSAEYPVPETSEAPPAATTPPPQARSELAREAPRPARQPAPARKPVKPADMPPEAVPQSAPAAAPAPFSDLAAQRAPPAVASATAPAAPAEHAAMARREKSAPAPQGLRARRAESAADARKDPATRDPRDTELERIARLRTEGRHDAADKALEAFRREHPQYRIPDAVWERVKPR